MGVRERRFGVWGGGCRYVGGRAGWSAEVLLVWGVPQACGYIYTGFPFASARALSLSLRPVWEVIYEAFIWQRFSP